MIVSGTPNLYMMWVRMNSETVNVLKSRTEITSIGLEKYSAAARIYLFLELWSSQKFLIYQYPSCTSPLVYGGMKGLRQLLYELPVMLAHLSPFLEFHAAYGHGRLLISQPFELHVKLRARLVSSTYIEMYLTNSLIHFMVYDTSEEYTVLRSPVHHTF